MLKLTDKLDIIDKDRLAEEDAERESHYAGDCNPYCWWCEEARILAEDAIGG